MSENIGHPEQQPQLKSPEVDRVEHAEPLKLDTSHEIESGLPGTKELAKAAEAQAVSGKEYSRGDQEAAPTHTLGLHQELKSSSYQKTLSSVRRQLSTPDQAFSKFVHAKGVEPIANAAAKTIGRPSGLLGGAVASLVASAYLLYMSKHYGFSYNYTTFILFFVGGFAVGLLVELLLAPMRRRRSED